MVNLRDVNNYTAYSCYDDAVFAWEEYCNTSGRSKADFQNGLLQPENLSKQPATQSGSRSGGNKTVAHVQPNKVSQSSSNTNPFDDKPTWEQKRKFYFYNKHKFCNK
jgi:hypothetical protein